MFKWLKNLFNKKNFIPKDIDAGLMTSMYYTANVGDKISVPENCVCFLSYRDKIYATYTAGTHSLDEKSLSALLQIQLKKKTKQKNIKFDLFYVNLKKFNFSTVQIEKIPIDKQMCKIEIKSNFDCKVVDSNKFQRYALSFYALIRPIDAEHLVKDFVAETINKYYIKRKFIGQIDSNMESNTVQLYLNKKAEKFGLNITRFELSFWVKTKGKQTEVKQKSFFDDTNQTHFEQTNLNNNTNKTVDETESLKYNLNDASGIENETNLGETKTRQTTEKFAVCPNCQSKRIANASFCPKCGFKF